jgi:hypothetical protein
MRTKLDEITINFQMIFISCIMQSYFFSNDMKDNQNVNDDKLIINRRVCRR